MSLPLHGSQAFESAPWTTDKLNSGRDAVQHEPYAEIKLSQIYKLHATALQGPLCRTLMLLVCAYSLSTLRCD